MLCDPVVASLVEELQTFASASLLNRFTVGPWACHLSFPCVSVFHLRRGRPQRVRWERDTAILGWLEMCKYSDWLCWRSSGRPVCGKGGFFKNLFL